jgi:hypothetical protein
MTCVFESLLSTLHFRLSTWPLGDQGKVAAQVTSVQWGWGTLLWLTMLARLSDIFPLFISYFVSLLILQDNFLSYSRVHLF